MADSFPLSQGITGATLRDGRARNIPRTDLDPDAEWVAGTPVEPEAMMCVPLEVAGRTIAMLNVYRYGEDEGFSEYEALIIERFGIIVALALDSARQRDLLRTQADTDDLTGLLNRRAFNHRLDVLFHRARPDLDAAQPRGGRHRPLQADQRPATVIPRATLPWSPSLTL